MSKIEFTETVLRDANQSLIATRLSMKQFESILDTMDQAGYYSVECWGGATFDSCIRYLDEDPWERLKIIKKHIKHTKLQMLLRGQNLLGYKHYSDDVVKKFVYNSVEKGIDIIRIFDALNDINNIVVAVEETLKCGAHPSCAISYTISPVHSNDNYVNIAKRMEEIGAQSICIKDMSGLLTPNSAYCLITELKKNISVPIVLHSHCMTGLAYMTYLKAIEAGVDIIDTAISSLSGGTSQPATEVMLKAALESEYEVNLNSEKVTQINEHFRKIKGEFIETGVLDTVVLNTDTRTLENQIPGGMYSNLVSQMKAQNTMEYFDDVLEEIPRVRKDLGYPPLVTPISQMVGAQAVSNVIAGERYQVILKEIKAYFRGEYGIPPGEVNVELMKQLTGQTTFPTTRLSKDMPFIYEETKQKYSKYGRSDILTTILFPELATDFIKNRDVKEENSYRYEYYKDEAMDSKQAKNVNLDDDTKAVLIAILAYKRKVPVETIKIQSISEIK